MLCARGWSCATGSRSASRPAVDAPWTCLNDRGDVGTRVLLSFPAAGIVAPGTPDGPVDGHDRSWGAARGRLARELIDDAKDSPQPHDDREERVFQHSVTRQARAEQSRTEL